MSSADSQLECHALILECRAYAENDLIVDFLTREWGRLSLLAKNARQSKKRFPPGTLEPFVHVKILFKAPESERMGLLTGASFQEAFPKIRQSYRRLQNAAHAVKLIKDYVPERTKIDELLFKNLGRYLRFLGTSNLKDKEIDWVWAYFWAHFALAQGFGFLGQIQFERLVNGSSNIGVFEKLWVPESDFEAFAKWLQSLAIDVAPDFGGLYIEWVGRTGQIWSYWERAQTSVDLKSSGVRYEMH